MLADIGQAQRLGVFDQRAEHPAATRQVADRAVGLLVDSNGQELLKLRAILVEDPDRGVARSGDLPCGLKDTIEHSLLVELGDKRLPDIEQLSMPSLVGILGHPPAELTRSPPHRIAGFP